MTREQAVAAADRAANAASRYGPDSGDWLLCGRHRGVEPCARRVRSHPNAPASAVYKAMAGPDAPPWSQLNPRRRVALEVFRATLIALDQIIDWETVVAA